MPVALSIKPTLRALLDAHRAFVHAEE